MVDEPRLGISAHAQATPDRPALVAGDTVRTFADFDERTTRLAHALARRGVAAGDRVAIMLPNGLEFFETWAAATKLDAPVVLVNWHLKADELAYILEDSQARLLVAHRDLAAVTAAAQAGGRACELLIVPDDYEAAIRRDGDGPPIEIEALDAPIFYTSGTTGRPKGVIHGRPDRNRAGQNMRGQLALWGWSADDVYIVTGPAYHAGPGGWAMAALYVGATTVILEIVRRARLARPRRDAPGHPHVHGPRPLHQDPRGPRGRRGAASTTRRCSSSSTPERPARCRSSGASSTRSRRARSPSSTG